MIDNKTAIETLTVFLQDNIGNKITVALANGILQMYSGELNRLSEMAELAAKGTPTEKQG